MDELFKSICNLFPLHKRPNSVWAQVHFTILFGPFWNGSICKCILYSSPGPFDETLCSFSHSRTLSTLASLSLVFPSLSPPSLYHLVTVWFLGHPESFSQEDLLYFPPIFLICRRLPPNLPKLDFFKLPNLPSLILK